MFQNEEKRSRRMERTIYLHKTFHKSFPNRQVEDIIEKVGRSCEQNKADKTKQKTGKKEKVQNQKDKQKICKSEWNNKTLTCTVGEGVLKYTELTNENETYEKEIRFRGRARNWNRNRMQNKSTCHTNTEQAVLVAVGNVVCAEGDLL